MSSDLLSRAEQAHQQGKLQQAEQLYREVLDAGSHGASARYGLGTLMMQRGELEQAEQWLAAAAQLEPGAADIVFNHALCLEQTGNRPAALAAAKRAASLSAGDEHFAGPIAELLLRLGDAASAISVLRAATLRQRSSLLLLARALGQEGAWDGAVSVLRQLLAQLPDDAAIAEQLSQAAARLRDYPLAVSAFHQFMAVSTTTARDHVRYADLLLLARDVPASEEQLALAANAGADDADYHLLCARVARLRGDDAAARRASHQALARSPDMGQAWAIRVELADDAQLPDICAGLAERRKAAAGSAYDLQLMAYAAAEVFERSDNLDAAAAALRDANQRQADALLTSGAGYRRDAEEQRFEQALTRFSAPVQGSVSLAGTSRYVFIVGMPRSGTTLIERVLGRLPGVVAGGESDALGFVVTQYERDVTAGYLGQPDALSADQWAALAQRYHALNSTTGEVVTDKMPHNYLHVGMLLGLFPDARVVQMRRDPRDTALSIFSRPFPDDHAYACDPDALAHAWHLSQRYMDHWAAIGGDRVMDLPLEDFVDDPEKESQRLAAFCDLAWDEACLQAQATDGPSFTFSERQVRGSIDSSQVGRWRRYRELLPELFVEFVDV